MGRPPTRVRSPLTGTGSRRAAAILVLGLLLLGALAGATSRTAPGASTLRAGPASDVLSVAITLGGLLGAAASAILIWGLATRGRGASVAVGRRTPAPFWQRMLVALCLGLAVATLVALGRRRPHPRQLAGATGPAHVHTSGSGSSVVHFVPAASISTLAVVAFVLATASAWSFLSARRHRQRWNLSGIIFGADGLSPGATIESAEALAESLATVHIPDPEEEKDPRRAVVAAYLAMTHAAAAAGARRRGDETPSEFLERLLDPLGASHDAARRLTLLFETARYSTKPFEEIRRSDAIAALRQIRAELSLSVVGTAL